MSTPIVTASDSFSRMTIRSYRSTDQELLERLFRTAWADSRFPFDPVGAHSDLRAVPDIYQSGGGDFWLLFDGAEPCGAVAVRALSPDVGEVKRFVVGPAWRGRGLGRHLLRHALDYAAGAGFRCARLDTLRNPGPATHLFTAFGFREIERYNDNPVAELFMEIDLKAWPARRQRDGDDAPL